MAPFLLSIRKCLTTSGYVPYTDFQLKQYMCTFRKRDQGMGRLVLYVPENRQAQVDEWRDKLNYSQLFFGAFDREVAFQKELEAMGKDGIDSVVERLKRDGEEAKKEAEDQGRALGVDWASWAARERHLRIIGSDDYDKLVPTPELLLRFLGDNYPDYALQEDGDIDFSEWNEKELDSMHRGFLFGVEEVWKQVRSKI